jgi:hypothetical protein
VSGTANETVFECLAFYNGRTNAVVEATAATHVDGTTATSSRVVTSASYGGISENVLSVASLACPFRISPTNLYANGRLVRPLR